jgi:hypothetical protein
LHRTSRNSVRAVRILLVELSEITFENERHRYREALEQGEKLARLKKYRGKRRGSGIQEPREQQAQTWIKTLDHKIRWYTFQFHTNNGVQKVIDDYG